jgi:hypothetical protein
MGVSDEAKNVIPLKFLRKIKYNFFFPFVNSIRGHTVCYFIFKRITKKNSLICFSFPFPKMVNDRDL